MTAIASAEVNRNTPPANSSAGGVTIDSVNVLTVVRVKVFSQSAAQLGEVFLKAIDAAGPSAQGNCAVSNGFQQALDELHGGGIFPIRDFRGVTVVAQDLRHDHIRIQVFAVHGAMACKINIILPGLQKQGLKYIQREAKLHKAFPEFIPPPVQLPRFLFSIILPPSDFI